MNHRTRILLLLILSFLTIILISIPANSVSGIMAATILIIVTATPIFCSVIQRDTTFIIVYLFFALYSIPLILYYFFGKDISSYRSICQTPKSAYILTLSMIVFYLGLIFGQWQLDNVKKINISNIFKEKNSNLGGYVVSIMLSLLCIVFGKSGDTIIASGGYGQGETQVSTLFAYGIIPLLTGLTCSNTKYKRIIIFVLCAFFCVKDLLYGGRIDSIQLCLGLYVLYFRYKWSLKKTILLAVLGFAFITLWGTYRAATERGLIYAYQHFGDEVSSNGNSSDVVYSSLGIIYLIQNGILTLSLRIQALVYFLYSIFLPFSWLPPLANLSMWEQSYVSTGGGGLISVFLYAMTGWLGIFGVAYIIGKCFRKFQRQSGSLFFSFWIILVIVNSPRWYAYYIIGIFKFALFGAILFILINKDFPRLKQKSSKG